MDDPPLDLANFDPSTLDLSHLHPAEQTRIKDRQFTAQELTLLLSGQNPWTESGKPRPLPPRSKTHARIKKPTLDDLRSIAYGDALPLLESGDLYVRAALEAQWGLLQAKQETKPEAPESEPTGPPDSQPKPPNAEPRIDDETRELLGLLSNAEEKKLREEQEQRQKNRGVKYIRQYPSLTAKEQADAELRRFMPKQVREEYNKADSRQRKVIWEANKRAFEAAKKREKERLARDQKSMEEVLDLLQQVREQVAEDPRKAGLLPPDDASTSDLRKWYQKMQEPKRPIPFPGVVDPPAGSSDASGQAELLRQREKMREEDRRRADLRKQQELVERQEALGSRSYQGAFDMLDAAADENARQRVRDKHEQRKRELDSLHTTPPPPTDPPWHKRADLVLAIILFCLGGVLAIGLLLLPRDTPGAIIFWLAVMFCLLAACALLLARFFDLSKPKTVASLLVPAILVAVFGWYIWPPPRGRAEIQKPIPSPDSSPSPSPSVQPSPKKLHDYFIEEIYQSATDELPLKIKVKGKDIPVEARIYMNFNTKSVFLGFYIPDTEHTTEVCQHLLRGHTGVLAAFVQLLQDKVEMGPIEGRKTQVKDLRFTKYLVIYHERSIPQSRKDLLDEEAKRLGLLVEYRSQEYVMARWK